MVTIGKNQVSQTNVVYLAPAWDLAMRFDMFLNSSTKFQILSWFSLSNSKFNWCKSQAGPFNYICFVSLFSTHTFQPGWRAIALWPVPFCSGDRGVGSLWLPLPHPKTSSFPVEAQEACGWVMVFWCGLFWPWWWWCMQYNHLVFQARRRICAMSVGGYCRL